MLFWLVNAALAASLAAAQTTQQVPFSSKCFGSSSVRSCYAVNVPSNSTTDLYISIAGSSTNGYTAVALGRGQMANSLYFIAQPKSDGTISLSVSIAAGEVRPSTYSATSVSTQQLDGSFVNSTNFLLNFRCSNCRSWKGTDGSTQSIDVTSSSQSFAYAWGSASSSGTIQQHSSGNYGSSSWNLVSASGTAGIPGTSYVTSGTSASASTTTSGTAAATSSASGTTSGSSQANAITSGETAESDSGSSLFKNLWLAHAIITTVALLLVAGVGAGAMKFLPLFAARRGFVGGMPIVRLHYLIQSTAVLIFLVGAILGFVASSQEGQGHFLYSHQTLGVIVFILVILQALGGAVHHMIYKSATNAYSAAGSARTSSPNSDEVKSAVSALSGRVVLNPASKRLSTTNVTGPLHRWLGRIILILAIVAVGLAFKQPMVDVNNTGTIIWYVLAFVILVGGYAALSLGLWFTGYRRGNSSRTRSAKV
ncbi:hypothetical protein PYCC9005_001780 [Savitreella phatthalungensis]